MKMRYKNRERFAGARVDDVIWQFWKSVPNGTRSALICDLLYDRIESENPIEHIHSLMRDYESGKYDDEQLMNALKACKTRYLATAQRHEEYGKKYRDALKEIDYIGKLKLEEEQKTLDF